MGLFPAKQTPHSVCQKCPYLQYLALDIIDFQMSVTLGLRSSVPAYLSHSEMKTVNPEGGLGSGQSHSVSSEKPSHFYLEEERQKCFNERINYNCPSYSCKTGSSCHNDLLLLAQNSSAFSSWAWIISATFGLHGCRWHSRTLSRCESNHFKGPSHTNCVPRRENWASENNLIINSVPEPLQNKNSLRRATYWPVDIIKLERFPDSEIEERDQLEGEKEVLLSVLPFHEMVVKCDGA